MFGLLTLFSSTGGGSSPSGIAYHVYGNDSAGGPVDESTPIATVSGLSWTSAPLPLSSDTTFLVRAYDTATGLEERGYSALARFRLDSAGNDLGSLPNAPTNLTAVLLSGMRLSLTWIYVTEGQGSPPTGFRLWLTPGSSVDYTTPPTVTVPYRSQVVGSTILSGLTAGSTYAVGIRAYNGSGVETNTSQIVVTATSTAPANVDFLTSSVSTAGPR